MATDPQKSNSYRYLNLFVKIRRIAQPFEPNLNPF